MEKERTDKTNINGKMIDLTQTVPLTTLNTNSKNTPIKKWILLNWIKHKIQRTAAYKKCTLSEHK